MVVDSIISYLISDSAKKEENTPPNQPLTLHHDIAVIHGAHDTPVNYGIG